MLAKNTAPARAIDARPATRVLRHRRARHPRRSGALRGDERLRPGIRGPGRRGAADARDEARGRGVPRAAARVRRGLSGGGAYRRRGYVGFTRARAGGPRGTRTAAGTVSKT